ncbi:hypothetical protein SEA_BRUTONGASTER_3 [Gordonia phage BrutonGaster]|uniref:Uncharacterized protein n=1 Tax=Gordonia phage BrutonGaster TaxID=2530116 RepID=A0A482JH15_9CAUD|nr:hypothetical protein HOV26_gp003 [Gordonia phage BrutonGaster]QBP33225.1 hypothetical protein SEA_BRUTONGASTER_3 [Gordonia phage BrutonGaster]
MSFVTLRIEFKDHVEDDGYVDRELCCARRIDTDLTPEEIAGVTECLGQSDGWHLATFSLLAAMENEGPVEL